VYSVQYIIKGPVQGVSTEAANVKSHIMRTKHSLDRPFN